LLQNPTNSSSVISNCLIEKYTKNVTKTSRFHLLAFTATDSHQVTSIFHEEFSSFCRDRHTDATRNDTCVARQLALSSGN